MLKKLYTCGKRADLPFGDPTVRLDGGLSEGPLEVRAIGNSFEYHLGFMLSFLRDYP